MKKIYIDYTGNSLGNQNVKFHGGGDFTRYILYKIKNYIDSQALKYDIIVLWPSNIDINSLSSDEIKIHDSFKSIKISSFNTIIFEPGSIVFLPLLDCFSILRVKTIRKMNPEITIYGVLHGTRILDVLKYDKYDKYYYDGLKSFDIFLWTRRKVAGIIAKYIVKSCVPLADRMYTVSNNSMQNINRIAKPKYIKFFSRNPTTIATDKVIDINIDDRFILFVSANRYEKNFIRSLIAYCEFIKITNSKTKLYVIGASKLLVKNIFKVKEIDRKIIEQRVIFKEYVDTSTLHNLYLKCEFLLYTTKSEGYGLPPLEAMNAGRPSVSSSITSVPEVLGMASYYVDPYDVNDIVKGLCYMDNSVHQNLYIHRLNDIKDILWQRGEKDVEFFIAELLN